MTDDQKAGFKIPVLDLVKLFQKRNGNEDNDGLVTTSDFNLKQTLNQITLSYIYDIT
jgi:hypothetical protein